VITAEVARDFAADYERLASGSAGSSDSPSGSCIRSTLAPTRCRRPLGATKLDPDILRNYTIKAANPSPLEIYPVFVLPAGDPADYAILASRLRRTYLHTEQATRFPAPMHLCDLADEYL